MIQESHPEVARSIVQILDMTADELQQVGAPVLHSGFDEEVSSENRQDQVRAALANIAIDNCIAEFDALSGGFYEVYPHHLYSNITPSELREFLYGTRSIRTAHFSDHLEFRGYDADSDQIKWLISVFRDLSEGERRKFFRFVTGTSQVPPGDYRIEIIAEPADDVRLPNTHTCFSQLHLPRYSSRAILREKILLAINSDPAMGTA